MDGKREFSLYVHVPFCRSKCPYCAFYSFRPRSGEVERWTDCIVKELAAIRHDYLADAQLATVYFGGGTPSYLPPEQWRTLFKALDALPRSPDCEFTVEANPDSVSTEKLALWNDHGVTRISIGVQSLDDDELKRLARPHTARQALDAVELCQQSCFRVSADLMFALPEQTLRKWHKSLSGIVRTGVGHISVYQLTIEPESFWGRHQPEGLPDGYAMYRWAQYYLPRNGLKQYAAPLGRNVLPERMPMCLTPFLESHHGGIVFQDEVVDDGEHLAITAGKALLQVGDNPELQADLVQQVGRTVKQSPGMNRRNRTTLRSNGNGFGNRLAESC